MRVSLILAHPDPRSLNHAIAQAARETLHDLGHDVIWHDLYAERFDPLLPAGEIPAGAPLPPESACHCQELAEADGIVIVHPNWWGQPLAILKGWVDRVLRPGVAYRFVEGDQGQGVPIGLLRARAALIFNTANTPPERERDVFGDPLQRTWVDCIFHLCGVPVVRREMFSVVVTSTAEQRAAWLERVRAAVRSHFPAAGGLIPEPA